MRLVIITLTTLLLSLSVCAQDKYVLPLKGGTAIYETAGKATTVATVTKEDRLQVLGENGALYRVKTPDGKIGFVEKKLVSKTEGKAYTFDNIQVEGYLDNPTPFYITDMDDGQNAPIDLERSFADALKQNTDKERVIRNSFK